MVLEEMHAKIDSLNTELAERHSQLLAEQEKLLEEQKKLMAEQQAGVEMLRLLRADQHMRFGEIGRKVSAVETNITESQSRLSRLDRQTAEVGRQLSQKLANDEEAASQRKLQLEKLFEIAMSDFNAGRYDLAINGFRDFVKQFPEAPQTIESEYWIAEAYYAKKEYEAAEKEYFEFVKKHPDGGKYCVSLYKLGLAYEHQEKTKSRDMVWKNLLDRCANSPEAQVVKSQQTGK
jgi:tol-pal system protein YbgF